MTIDLDVLLRDVDKSVPRCPHKISVEVSYFWEKRPCERAEGHPGRCSPFDSPRLAPSDSYNLLMQVLKRLPKEP